MARSRESLLNRKAKYYNIKSNLQNSIPKKIIVLDTETSQHQEDDKTIHTLKLGWMCVLRKRDGQKTYTEEWIKFNNCEEICLDLNNMFKGKSSFFIVGHNIFFDLQVMQFFYWMPKFGWKLRFYYEKGMTYAMILKRDQTSLKIISTTNFFATSLKEMGKIVGKEKIEIAFENCTDDELSIYCKNDVEITKRIFLKYVEFVIINDLGKFSITRASQAMHAFRHKFMIEKITIHDDEEAMAHERKAYMGGRNEAYRVGQLRDDRYVTLDINSMYPYVMQYNEMPTRLVDAQNCFDIIDLRHMFEKYCMIAEVKLKTNEPAYAKRMNGKIIFPIGTFNTYLCTTGLFYAWNNNHLIEIKRIQFYDKKIIFNKYIEHFWMLRKKYKEDKNKIFETCCKLFMNSLYGKFGQRTISEQIEIKDNPEMYYRVTNYFQEDKHFEIETGLMNTIITNGDEEMNKEAMVSIPAHITEDARFLLWSIIKSVGIKNVLYCDTDSIKIRAKHIDRLSYIIDEKTLGTLKIETISKSLIIFGCKDYADDYFIKHKGIPLKARLLSPNVFEYDTWLSQNAHLRAKENRIFVVKKSIKELKRHYDKGNVDEFGNVTPLILSE